MTINILRGKRVEDLFHKQGQEAWRGFGWIYHESLLLIPWKTIRRAPLLVWLAFPCMYYWLVKKKLRNYIFLWLKQEIENINQRFIHYQLRKSEAVDQMKKRSIEVMEAWQTRVMKLYSTTSNKNHKRLTPITSVAAIFGSLHNIISATVNQKYQKSNFVFDYNITCRKPWRHILLIYILRIDIDIKHVFIFTYT